MTSRETRPLTEYEIYCCGPWRHPVRPAPRQSRVMAWAGAALIGVGLAVGAHVLLAAPSKIAATVKLHHQIAGVAE